MRFAASAVRGFVDRHLFRIVRAEPLPARLGHRRIFVLPTALGFGFAVTLLTMLIASMNYNLSLGYGLTFLLAGVGIVSMHHAFRNLVHLELRSVSLGPVHCGQPAPLQASFENPAGHPREALELRCNGSQHTRFVIAAGARASVELTIPTTRRGWLEPGRLLLETRYPLGLVRAWSVLTPALRGLVYPAPETPAIPFPAETAQHSEDLHGAQGREDFAGLRGYRAGDSPRHIAWKAAARDDSVLRTKQFRGGGHLRREFDWFALPEALDVETRLSRLTRWVLDSEASGADYGLRLPGVRIPISAGSTHRERCLRALALHGIDDAV